MGVGISAIVTVRLASPSQDEIAEFLAAVHQRAEITECVLVAGNIDYVLRVQVPGVEDLRDFILTGLKTVPCVSDTSTMLILETSKSVAPLPSSPNMGNTS